MGNKFVKDFYNNIPDAMGTGNVWCFRHQYTDNFDKVVEAINYELNNMEYDFQHIFARRGEEGHFVYMYHVNDIGNPVSLIAMPYKTWQKVSAHYNVVLQ